MKYKSIINFLLITAFILSLSTIRIEHPFSANKNLLCRGVVIVSAKEKPVVDSADGYKEWKLKGIEAALNDSSPVVNALAWQKFAFMMGNKELSSGLINPKVIASLKSKALGQVPGIIKLLRSPDQKIKSCAVDALSFIAKLTRDKGIAQKIRKVLKYEKSSPLSSCIILALARAAGEAGDKDIIPLLKQMLRDNRMAVREDAVAALGILGKKVNDSRIPKLLTGMLDDRAPMVRKKAAVSLGWIIKKPVDPEIAAGLMKMSKGKHFIDRLVTVEVLAKIAALNNDQKITFRLVDMLKIYNSSTRFLAADRIIKIVAANGDLSVTKKLFKMMRGQRDMRRLVILILGGIAEKTGDPASIKMIIKTLKDKKQHWRIHCYALKALGPIGQKTGNPEILNIVLSMTDHENSDVRVSALEALGDMVRFSANSRVAECVLKAVDDKKWTVASTAAGTLGKIGRGSGNELFMEKLREALKKTGVDWKIQSAQVLALGLIGKGTGNYKIIDIILETANDKKKDWKVRSASVYALKEVYKKDGREKIIYNLLSFMNDKDLISASVETLGDIRAGTEAAGAMEKYLNHENPNIREVTVEALGKMGKAATGQIPDMAALLKDPNSEVIKAASFALEKLGPIPPDKIKKALRPRRKSDLLGSDYNYRDEENKFLLFYLTGGKWNN